jgi:hypothetical protein
LIFFFEIWPIPMAARSEVSVCGTSLAGIAGSNPAAKVKSLRQTHHLFREVLPNLFA